MAYLETPDGSGMAYRCSQEGSSSKNNIMSTVKLYSGSVVFPLLLACLEGRDGLSLSLQATYQSGQASSMTQCNRDSAGSVLGSGWSMPLACIAVRDRTVKQGYQSDFYLIGEGGQYPLYRTGKTDDKVEFFSVEHPLWKFFYCDTAPSEHWEICKEDGSVWIYGGSEDSTEIGLAWDNWVGPVCTNGGESFPVGWYLSKIISYDQSSLSYEYENVRETLGDASYTRTIRLKNLVSTYDQQIKLYYLPKESFEYELPHQDVKGQNAYQFSFEDHYLDHIEVYNSENALLYTQLLEYQFFSIAQGDKKRLLTQVRQVTPQGKQLQALSLEYFQNGANPGALSRVTYPTGEKLNYTYSVEEFPNSNGSMEIPSSGADWTEKTITAADFMVLTASRDDDFKLKVYFWDMQWRCFEDTSFKGQPVKNPQVYTGNGFFAVRYLSLAQGIYAIRLFKRSPVRRYDWESMDILLENEQNAPAVTCGSDFLAVQYRQTNRLQVFQFNYTDNTWTKFDLPVESMDFQALGSGRGCIFGAYGRAGGNRLTLRSFYADDSHTWQNGSSIDLDIDPTCWELTVPDYVWSIGSCQASATFISLDSPQSIRAVVVLLRWRDLFTFAGFEKYELEQGADVKNPAFFAVTTGSVIGFAQNVFRYTPQRWNPHQLLTPRSGGEYRYSYGSDLALATEKTNGRQRFYSVRFDPYLQSWVQEGAPAAEDLDNVPFVCQPLVAGEYAVLGRSIFARNTRDQWDHIGYFPDQADLSTVQFDPQGGYLIYQLLDGSTLYQMPIVNHETGTPVKFEGQCCQTKDGSIFRAGPGAFITCAPEGQPLCFHLHGIFQSQCFTKRSLAIVSSAVIDSGFDLQSFYFSYGLEDARLEGETAAFHRLRVLPVDAGGKYGATEYVYFNGCPPDQIEYPEDDQFSNARAFYSHYAGRLYYTRVYDNTGQPVSGSVNWMRAMDTNGFCICQTKMSKQSWLLPYQVDQEVAGEQAQLLEEIVEQEYEPKFFQRRKITKIGTDTAGNPARISQTFRYGWEEYEALLAAHLLTEVVENEKSEEISGTVLECTRNVYQPCADGRWRQTETWLWDGTGDRSHLGDNWILQTKNLQFDQHGQTLCQIDDNGLARCRTYDRSNSLIVAEFTDARPEEVVYCGFEPYEAVDRRLVISEGDLTGEEFFSGTRCLCLHQGGSLTIKLQDVDRSYLLHLAVKTDAAFDIRYSLGDHSQTKTFAGTKGVWQTVSLSIPVSGDVKADLTIEIIGNPKLLLDTVFLTPLTCKAHAFVYTSVWMLQTAKHLNNGTGLRTLYNDMQCPILTARDDNSFIGYTRYILGATAQTGAPNETLTLEMPESGSFYSMEQGKDFLGHWNVDGQWAISQHKLVAASGQGVRLSCAEDAGPYFSLFISAFQGAPAIVSGTLRLQPEGNKWVFYENETEIADAVLEQEGQYLLLRMGNRVQFSCNDKILLTYRIAERSPSHPVITLPSGCAVGHLGLCPRPKVTVTYADYTGRPMQDQAATETGVIAGQTSYTPLGQQGVTTKRAEFADSLWQYRKDFVKSFDWETGIIQGEINDYYPEDEGFPYVRGKTTLNPDPEARELGQAGKALAIQGGNDKTVRLQRYTNGSLPIPLSSGQFYVDTVCDADHKETVQIKDKLDRKCCEIIQNRTDGLRQITAYENDWEGNPVKIYYPNYFGDRPDKDRFVAVLRYDPMGRLAQRTEPDMGSVCSIYDRRGQLRFLQTAAAADWFIYHAYDRFGRETEVGRCSGRWDEQELRQKAEQYDYIPDSGVASKKVYYDGDGSDLNSLDQISRCLTYGPEGVTEEEFTYDCLGNIVRYRQTVGQHTDILIMEYDQRGKLLSQSAGQGAEFKVRYRYDLQERLTQVDYGNAPVYRCSYSPSGNLAEEIYAPGAAGEVVRRYEYSPSRWLTGITDPFFNQTIRYFNQDGTGRFGGQITGVSSAFTDDLPQGVQAKLTMNYQYDGLGRLTSAVSAGEPGRKMLSGAVYDSNGNMLKSDGHAYGYETGTNRLQSVQGYQYSYDANGAAASVPGHGIEKIAYDRVLQTVETVQTAGDTKSYQQGSNGVAAYRDQNGICYCLRDLKGRLLRETRPDGSQAVCLHGANSLFAQVVEGKMYYYLKDYQSSVRGIYDGSRLCAAYSYTPFGGFLGDVWEAEDVKKLIPFGFTGHILETTGIYRLNTRFYDPLCGRFLSVDPEGQYTSPYLYGGSDWINYVDPDGAFSWGSFFASMGAIVGGIALVVVGAALTAATAGIASPVGAFLATLGAAALIGAGIGATIYGITSAISNDFKATDLLIYMGMGGAFAMAGAATGALLPAGFTMFGLSAAASSAIVDVMVGVVVGAADSLVTNGLLNVSHGQDFWQGWETNLIVGCLTGGVAGGLSGLGSGLRNAKAMTGVRNRRIAVGLEPHGSTNVSHSTIWKLTGGGSGSDLIPSNGILKKIGNNADIRNLPVVGRYNNYPAWGYKSAEFNVPNSVYNRIQFNNIGLQPNNYNIVTNNCSGYVIRKLAEGGISAPLWARMPTTLYYWSKLFALWG